MDEEHPTPRFFLQTAAMLPLLAVFLALFYWFYLDLMSSYIPERGITLNIASAAAPSIISSSDTLRIDIQTGGTVSIAGVLSESPGSSDLLLLRQHLRSHRDAINQQGGLVVRPDPEVRFERIIDVLSAITSSGILRYDLN